MIWKSRWGDIRELSDESEDLTELKGVWGFDWHVALENVASKVGFEYQFPPVDYTIHV